MTPVARSPRIGTEAATGLGLAGALALGIVLAGEGTGADVDSALFGTLLGLTGADLLLCALAAVGALAATGLNGRSWLAAGFDPGSARSFGVDGRRADAVLLVLVALTVVATLPAVGALLVSAVLVVPAATARLLARSVAGCRPGRCRSPCRGGRRSAARRPPRRAPGPAVTVTGAAIFALAAVVRR